MTPPQATSDSSADTTQAAGGAQAQAQRYQPKHNIRVVTAAALFDGHDAAINVMRRILQQLGAEVIHLGHNRSAEEIVDAAIQEDAQALAVSSYQGGHMEFFKYMFDLLREKGAGHIKIFGGGGGVIVPREIKELHEYGINRIFSPEDGRELGLEGMISHIIREIDFSTLEALNTDEATKLAPDQHSMLARFITACELRETHNDQRFDDSLGVLFDRSKSLTRHVPVIGLTGTGGAGKSSLTDELLLRFTADHPDWKVAVLSVDPSKRKTGGALLGDRIRMNALINPNTFMRSLATRASGVEVSPALKDAIEVCKGAGFDLVLVETSGIGQGSSAITDLVDIPVYVMTAEYGAASQLEKIDMLDFAQLVALNKFERRGSLDALRDVKKQIWRNRGDFNADVKTMPVFPTIASKFNDPGVNAFYQELRKRAQEVSGESWGDTKFTQVVDLEKLEEYGAARIIPPKRDRYLSEVAESVRAHHTFVHEQARLASAIGSTFSVLYDMGDTEVPCRLELYDKAQVTEGCTMRVMNERWEEVEGKTQEVGPLLLRLRQRYNELIMDLDSECRELLAAWPELIQSYKSDENVYSVRGKEIRVQNFTKSLSGSKIPKVSMPRFSDWGDNLSWALRENVPGRFPYTAGVFPYKRVGEDPTRMFAGEGPPSQTNARFHLVSEGQPAARLSTAFDSVTLYGDDPHERPDIYGKIGESGVSICTVEDMEILYAGFDLCSPTTSVSKTINGPAPIILAFFMNAAVRQQCRKHLMEAGKLMADRDGQGQATGADAWQDTRNFSQLWDDTRKLLSDEEYAKIQAFTLASVRGTVQADILKEDQAQNTWIFSTEFALRMMGDVQAHFIDCNVRNYYSVSISGYHIAEAGANPITQLALTLANGFTYVEYYLSRGMNIDDFAPNLSFFFSNGIDPEYAVIGRVARRIWAIALKRMHNASARAQMLKYHIQTSGRSLHAMEIDFNDIRTTLQALYAIYDNCNSLHTNAYDEAITTPTEESVRRALAIQLIINRELGLAKNENPLQGSFIIEELTELVEEAVLTEFDRLTERGGVLGAMETQYQRGKIQEESMHYEMLKHTGELPLIGVNTFLNPNADRDVGDKIELRRASKESKDAQIVGLRDFQSRHASTSAAALDRLQKVALSDGNIFAELMDTVQHCSLGQISGALYAVGGKYRRNM